MNPVVRAVYQSYPESVQLPLLRLRELVYTVAKELDIKDLEETLKWGEPAYLCASGSTLRLAWSNKRPEAYGIYFNCQSKLIETFRQIFPDLSYSGNRAILFEIGETLPLDALKVCFAMALDYHALKKQALLGWA